MRKTDPQFDEYFLITVLADLFDDTDSNDVQYLSTKIIEGLEENGLLSFDNQDERPLDDIAAA